MVRLVSSKPTFLFGYLLSTFIINTANCQTIGVDTCACSPSEYEFTLDLNLGCSDSTIFLGGPIEASTCFVTSPVDDPARKIPVSVQEIEILELSQNFVSVTVNTITGNFGTGYVFGYTSYASAESSNIIENPSDNIYAIQVTLKALNSLDEEIENKNIITFSNSCDYYPSLSEGQTTGWVRFTSLTPPKPELCPISIPSNAPTVSLQPTTAPSSFISAVPTAASASKEDDTTAAPTTESSSASFSKPCIPQSTTYFLIPVLAFSLCVVFGC